MATKQGKTKENFSPPRVGRPLLSNTVFHDAFYLKKKHSSLLWACACPAGPIVICHVAARSTPHHPPIMPHQQHMGQLGSRKLKTNCMQPCNQNGPMRCRYLVASHRPKCKKLSLPLVSAKNWRRQQTLSCVKVYMPPKFLRHAEIKTSPHSGSVYYFNDDSRCYSRPAVAIIGWGWTLSSSLDIVVFSTTCQNLYAAKVLATCQIDTLPKFLQHVSHQRLFKMLSSILFLILEYLKHAIS